MTIEKYTNNMNTVLIASNERDECSKDTLISGSYTINKSRICIYSLSTVANKEHARYNTCIMVKFSLTKVCMS